MKRKSTRGESTRSDRTGLRRTVDDLKAELVRDVRARRNRYGTIGERLFERILTRRGHTVQSVHGGSYDFLVDKRTKVDVKTKVTLHKTRPTSVWRVSGKRREKEIIYGYVLLAEDKVTIFLEDENAVPKIVEELEWREVAPLWDELEDRPVSQSSRAEDDHAVLRRNTAKLLQAWIDSQWHRNAAIRVRSSRRAQESMAMRRWGPESFYQDPKAPHRPDLVVLLFFDRDTVFEVMAYPITQSSRIEWKSKPVGVNRAGRRTFDPATLSEEFKFGSMADFKKHFPVRFLMR